MQDHKHSKGMSKSEMGLWKPWSGWPGMGMEQGGSHGGIRGIIISRRLLGPFDDGFEMR